MSQPQKATEPLELTPEVIAELLAKCEPPTEAEWAAKQMLGAVEGGEPNAPDQL